MSLTCWANFCDCRKLFRWVRSNSLVWGTLELKTPFKLSSWRAAICCGLSISWVNISGLLKHLYRVTKTIRLKLLKKTYKVVFLTILWSESNGFAPHRRWWSIFHSFSWIWSFSASALSHSHLIRLHVFGGSTEHIYYYLESTMDKDTYYTWGISFQWQLRHDRILYISLLMIHCNLFRIVYCTSSCDMLKILYMTDQYYQQVLHDRFQFVQHPLEDTNNHKSNTFRRLFSVEDKVSSILIAKI